MQLQEVATDKGGAEQKNANNAVTQVTRSPSLCVQQGVIAVRVLGQLLFTFFVHYYVFYVLLRGTRYHSH
jgi:hypothetical protein